MPSTSLQSRINAFESLAVSKPKPIKPSRSPHLLETPISPAAASLSVAHFPVSKVPSRSPSPSPPNLGRKTSLIDLKDWIVDDGPPKHNGFAAHRTNGKPVRINDFSWTSTRRELEFDNVKPPTNGQKFTSTPLINLESPPKSKGPPLPPRKASYNSFESTSDASKSSGACNASSTSLPAPKRSDSLTVEHTYPPPSKLNLSDASRSSPGHAHVSSISSFQSVSLSSDGGNTDPSTPGSISNLLSPYSVDQDSSEADTVSLDESYENVSATSIASPTTAASMALNWDKAMAQRGPPKLPQRPPFKPPTPVSPPAGRNAPVRVQSTVSSSSSSSHPTAVRRVPPPPPSRPPSSRGSLISNTTSDRSSTLSTATATTSHTSVSIPANNQPTLLRPTPVPAAARRRYEAVFIANVLKNRKPALTKPTFLSVKKSRHAAGWRGLSVDIIMNPGEYPLDNASGKGGGEENVDKEGGIVGADERLDGGVVKLIWSKSRLDKGKLRNIWNECDTVGLGALDRDSFVKGMWRIDEELRRTHFKSSSASPLSTASLPASSFRTRPPSKATKLILR